MRERRSGTQILPAYAGLWKERSQRVFERKSGNILRLKKDEFPFKILA